MGLIELDEFGISACEGRWAFGARSHPLALMCPRACGCGIRITGSEDMADHGCPNSCSGTAPVLPLEPGTWEVTGTGCTVNGDCIQSNNYPAAYGNDAFCSINVAAVTIVADPTFSTEQ